MLFLSEWIRAAVRALRAIEICARCPILKDEGSPGPLPVSCKDDRAFGGRPSEVQMKRIESSAVNLVRSMTSLRFAVSAAFFVEPSTAAMISHNARRIYEN